MRSISTAIPTCSCMRGRAKEPVGDSERRAGSVSDGISSFGETIRERCYLGPFRRLGSAIRSASLSPTDS